MLRLQVLLRRRSASGIATVLRAGALELDERARTAELGGCRLELIATELHLLVYLVRHCDRVVPAQELVRKVLTQQSGEASNVRFHIHHLRAKLGDYGKRIEAVRGRGYRWVDNP